MEESLRGCLGSTMLFVNLFGYNHAATYDVMTAFINGALVHVDPRDFYSMLVYYFLLLKTSSPLSSQMSDLALMISVALYINKMHSDTGFEIWDFLHDEMGVKQLCATEAQLIPHLHMLPSLLFKKDIANINAAINAAALSALPFPSSTASLSALSSASLLVVSSKPEQSEKELMHIDMLCLDELFSDM